MAVKEESTNEQQFMISEEELQEILKWDDALYEQQEYNYLEETPLGNKMLNVNFVEDECTISDMTQEQLATTLNTVKGCTDNIPMGIEFLKGRREISSRGKSWLEFSDLVLNHIETYVSRQYGDEKQDIVSNCDTQHGAIQFCFMQVNKYIKRFGTNSRPDQEDLDFYKMAHYIQLAFKTNFKTQD